jgi:tRNA (guanine26-N2/guanine27-N2)-dimethyltransferase
MLRCTACAAAHDAASPAVVAPGAPGRRPRFAGGAPRTAPAPPVAAEQQLVTERGVTFDTRDAFFRGATVHARDLAVLVAELQRRDSATGECRVLDVMTGAGIRAARYLRHAGATLVHANDIDAASPAAANLAALAAAASAAGTPVAGAWRTTREESCRLLSRLALEGEAFDVVDVDGFGSRGVPPGLALGVTRFGGLLLLNSTDWALGSMSAATSSSASVIAAFGSLLHPCPCMPEQGLRVLLGAVAREAAQRGLRIQPLLSYYAPGPAWRVMVRVFRGGSSRMTSALGFNAHCAACGASWPVPWSSLGGGSACACGSSATLSGPLWHGPLHDADELRRIEALAVELGWDEAPPFEAGTPEAASVPRRSLGALLRALRAEADAALPPHYVRLEEVARAGGKLPTPARDALIAALRERGHAAAGTHCEERALKTSAPWQDVLDAARSLAAAAAAAPPA